MDMHLAGGMPTIGFLVGLAAVMTWRLRESRTPVSMRKIILPPMGMAMGFAMFIAPAFRIPWAWAGAALLIGGVGFAYPLMLTSRLVRQGNVIMMQRSGLFIVVMVLLAAIRLVARGYFDSFLSPQQTAALFFMLAFGMIVRWRARMFFEYRCLARMTMAESISPRAPR